MREKEPTALVLSAGGMFGAYQAGVWQELAHSFSPDIVVGASVGSLNGWQIACGCQPETLAERWLELGGLASIRWRIPRSLSEGLLDSSALEAEIRKMCDEGTPRRRLGIVMTEIPSLKPVLFETPDVGWIHVAASCAVPLFLRHHRIDGRWYSDGGIIDPLPLAAALAMGARNIVTVNLMNHRPWPVRKAVSLLRRWSGYTVPETESVRVIDVSPNSPLGPVLESACWSRETAARFIERGRQDARQRLPSIVQWSEREFPDLANVSYPPPA